MSDLGSKGIIIRIAKTKTLISCAVTAQLICVFVFAYAKIRFSNNEAHFMTAAVNSKVFYDVRSRTNGNAR